MKRQKLNIFCWAILFSFLLLPVDYVNSDPDWQISTSPEFSTFIIQSPDVFSNIIIEATLNSDNQADIASFSVGTTTLSGNINFINETTLTMLLSLESPTQSFD